MTYAKADGQYIIRLEKGELLVESLMKLAKKENLKSGFVSGIGGLLWAEIGFYDITAKAYVWTRYEELLELLSLNGSLSWSDGKPFYHLHTVVSDASQYARGGHLNEAQVGGTAEIHIQVWKGKQNLSRKFDKQTKLNLLDL